jgi:hypothetical protein
VTAYVSRKSSTPSRFLDYVAKMEIPGTFRPAHLELPDPRLGAEA